MRYTHENGYSAELYGVSSMSVYFPDGKLCYHTGGRNVNTESEVMEVLERMPNEQQALTELITDLINDDEGEDDI